MQSKITLLWFLILISLSISFEDEKEVILVIQLSGSGISSPTDLIASSLFNATWEQGPNELSPSGERQSYLLGKKLRNLYIENDSFLPAEYDRKSVYVRTIDSNSTKMSAQSQLLGLYPLGTGEEFSNTRQRSNAIPPFTLSSSAKAKISMNEVLGEKYNPIQLHTVPKSDDKLLRRYDLCPIIPELQQNDFKKHDSHDETYSTLFEELEEKFGIFQDDLIFSKAYPYIEAWKMATLDGQQLSANLSDRSINLIHDYFNEYSYKWLFKNTEKVSRLSSSELIDYLSTVLDLKLKAHKNDTSIPEFYKNIKLILLSGQDTTLMSLLTAFELQGLTHAYPSSHIRIELNRLGN